MTGSNGLDTAAALLREARRVFVLTGAGVSTESGIPDFRSPGGLWTRYDPRELTYDKFCSCEETRRSYWRMATEAYPTLDHARPNAAHRAIVQLERAGRLLQLVTQNIDGLHQKAGSDTERIIEIHGSALRVSCIECGKEFDRGQVHRRVLEGDSVPYCDACRGPLKPATVSFGQPMPERETLEAFEAASKCDLMIVVGSSLVVYPAAGLPDSAVAAGARLIIVNKEPTDKDANAAAVLRGSAGEAMSMLVRHAGIDAEPRP